MRLVMGEILRFFVAGVTEGVALMRGLGGSDSLQ